MPGTDLEVAPTNKIANTFKTAGYAANSATSPLAPFSFERRDPGPQDVQIEILYCGVCHSDLHTARNEWTNTTYPVVPGHEIVGRVSKVGSRGQEIQSGRPRRRRLHGRTPAATVRVAKRAGEYCENVPTFTYNSEDKHLGGMTYGGYSQIDRRGRGFRAAGSRPSSTCPQSRRCFAPASPPIRRCGTGRSARARRSASSGLGGLGHMGLKLAHALGAHVVLFTTSTHKAADAKAPGRS